MVVRPPETSPANHYLERRAERGRFATNLGGVRTTRDVLDAWLAAHEPDLIATRRDLHAHPETAFAEHRTTELVMTRLRGLGWQPRPLPGMTGVVCDIGAGVGPLIALRADIDALPLQDAKDVPYRSVNAGACHACGHDAHTTILLGAAAVLATLTDLPRIRLIFQPAEEVIPGGAERAIETGVLDDVEQIYALHCDPRVDTGEIGTRVGPITAACDTVQVTLAGPGGHTARPHLTADLIFALGLIITELPALVARRTDARAGASADPRSRHLAQGRTAGARVGRGDRGPDRGQGQRPVPARGTPGRQRRGLCGRPGPGGHRRARPPGSDHHRPEHGR
jgi:hypothetical protein